MSDLTKMKIVGVVLEHFESVVVDVKSVGIVPEHFELVAIDVKSVGVVPEQPESDVKSTVSGTKIRRMGYGNQKDAAKKHPLTDEDKEILKELQQLVDQRGCLLPGLRGVILLKKQKSTPITMCYSNFKNFNNHASK